MNSKPAWLGKGVERYVEGMMAEDMGGQGGAHGLGGRTGDCWILGTVIDDVPLHYNFLLQEQ